MSIIIYKAKHHSPNPTLILLDSIQGRANRIINHSLLSPKLSSLGLRQACFFFRYLHRLCLIEFVFIISINKFWILFPRMLFRLHISPLFQIPY